MNLWRGPRGAASIALAGPECLYRTAVRLRNVLYDCRLRPARRLPCAVVSLGNLTVGGSGKTPLTSFIAGLLREAGYRVGVVSRGYGRRGGRAPLLVSDGRSILVEPEAAGDEPSLIARDNPAVPVAVGSDRFAAARLLLQASPCEVLVLDDAFQHRRLARDVNLLLVDGRDPWGNGKMLPRGPLREPPSAVLRADGVLVTRSEGRLPTALAAALDRYNPGAAVFHCTMRARAFVRGDGESIGPAALKGLTAYAFSGIARPDRFEADLRDLGIRLGGTRHFADHHRFARRDLEAIAAAARMARAEVLVTTEKDLVRILKPPADAPPLYALVQAVIFGDGDRLPAFLLDRLATATGAVRPR